MKKHSTPFLALVLLCVLVAHATQAQVVLTSPDGKGKKIAIDEATGKYQVHLEGTAFQMGYQHGYLLAETVKFSCSNKFYQDMVLTFGGEAPELAEIIRDDAKFAAILGAVETICLGQSVFATQAMRDEMLGISWGAKRRLRELGQDSGDIRYSRVVLTNLAFDVLLSVAYPIITDGYMTEEQREAFWQNWLEQLHMCDGFVVAGSATTTGATLMGRSFMIPPFLSNRSVVMEYVPNSGNRFAACNLPGFVGTPVAMNEHGLAIGMDMVPTIFTNPVASGMGCLLTARYAAQWTNNVDDAVEAIRQSPARGCPWIYLIGDRTSGAVAEAGATYGCGIEDDALNHFAARYLDYQFIPGDLFQEGVHQLEERDDIVTTSNHFVDPGLVAISGSYAVADSIVRYDYLTVEVVEAAQDGMTPLEAKQLVNYLSPMPDNPYADDMMANRYGAGERRVGDWYGSSPYVGGVRAMFDMQNMEMHVYYNLWTDPWVVFKF